MFKQTLKNFSIQFNASNERNTVTSGDLVTGHISFDLTNETKITSITMSFKGKVHVHWSTGGGGKKSQRRHYSAKLEYFNLMSYIVPDPSVSGQATRLRPGTHMFPFSCQIPQGDFPSSFQGPHGRISYTLTIGINRPWHMTKEFKTQLNFVNHINPNQPTLGAPLSGSNTKTVCCFCCASGEVHMTVSTEKKAFNPGETVRVICDFENASTRKVTPKVKLQQRQVYYTANRVSKRMIFKWLVYITGHPINPRTSTVRNEILLTIPAGTLYSISNCSILELEYFIEVTLSARCASDLTVLIPIIICDAVISPQPPPYLH